MTDVAWRELRHATRMPVDDPWIAATAMAHGVPVVTQDDDFPEVEGLTVARV